MTCDACKKRWYCISACPEVNSALSETYEELSATEKIITFPWYAGRLFSQPLRVSR